MAAHSTTTHTDHRREAPPPADDPAAPLGDAGSATRRAPTLPPGRALVGGLLVTGAAVAAFLVASRAPAGPDTSYVVLARAVDAGRALTADDLDLVPLHLGDRLAAMALTSPRVADGAVPLRDLRPGELLLDHDLIGSVGIGGSTPTDVHELTIPVPVDRSPADIVPGDRVTVLATLGPADQERTVVSVEDATVLDVVDDDGLGSRTATLTLAIDDPQLVIDVAELSPAGTVTVVRTTRALDDVYPTRTLERASPPPPAPAPEATP